MDIKEVKELAREHRAEMIVIYDSKCGDCEMYDACLSSDGFEECEAFKVQVKQALALHNIKQGKFKYPCGVKSGWLRKE